MSIVKSVKLDKQYKSEGMDLQIAFVGVTSQYEKQTRYFWSQ